MDWEEGKSRNRKASYETTKKKEWKNDRLDKQGEKDEARFQYL